MVDIIHLNATSCSSFCSLLGGAGCLLLCLVYTCCVGDWCNMQEGLPSPAADVLKRWVLLMLCHFLSMAGCMWFGDKATALLRDEGTATYTRMLWLGDGWPGAGCALAQQLLQSAITRGQRMRGKQACDAYCCRDRSTAGSRCVQLGGETPGRRQQAVSCL
jgi:hypothetical protein